MKKFLIIAGFAAMATGFASCGGAKGNDPGRAYMPDMMYSRAYETYGYNNIGDYDRLREAGVNYRGLPVVGTMARDDESTYPYASNDSGYAMSVGFRNPIQVAAMQPMQMKEAERVYLVNCAICHGSNLDGNGPLWKGGDGPYPAAPRNLKDDYTKGLADGTMYHVITYGKGQMGSYASQLKPHERWWVINYIRQKQGNGKAVGDSIAASASTIVATAQAGAKADTAATKTK